VISTAPAPPGRTEPAQEIAFDVTVWRSRARVVVHGGPLSGLVGDSGYVLVSTEDTMVTAVNPVRREVLLLGRGGMAPGAQFGMNVVVSDVSVTTRRVAAGEPIAGFRTQQVQSEQAFTTTLTAGTMRRVLRTTQKVSVQQSAEVLRLAPGFRAFRDQVLVMLDANAAARAELRSQLRELDTGFPLAITATGNIVVGADTSVIASRGRISALRAVALDTMAFVIPPTFRVTELRRLMQPRSR
jgi:hypothetical protein